MALDVNGLDEAGLVRNLVQRQHALVKARFAKSQNRLENTASLRILRKEIARLHTEIRRREIAAGLPKDELLRKHPVDPRSLETGAGAGAQGGLLADVVDKIGG